MAIWRCLAALGAAGLEGMAAAAAAGGEWRLALALHAAACAAAAGLHRSLLAGPAARGAALLFAGTFFLPFLGALGLAAVVLASPREASAAEPDLVCTPVPGPPRTAADGELPRPPGEREARLAALAATRRVNDPAGVARLWSALADPDEDVRLLAHSVLEAKSRAAHSRIHDLERQLAKAPLPGRAAIHRRLAVEQWELAWLGLVQGDCLAHALEVAREHALAALGGEPDSGPLQVLLGRIELRRGRPREATAALLRAAELGVPSALVGSYLAEAAFVARRFDLVPGHLAGAGGGNETVDRIRGYWS